MRWMHLWLIWRIYEQSTIGMLRIQQEWALEYLIIVLMKKEFWEQFHFKNNWKIFFIILKIYILVSLRDVAIYNTENMWWWIDCWLRGETFTLYVHSKISRNQRWICLILIVYPKGGFCIFYYDSLYGC